MELDEFSVDVGDPRITELFCNPLAVVAVEGADSGIAANNRVANKRMGEVPHEALEKVGLFPDVEAGRNDCGRMVKANDENDIGVDADYKRREGAIGEHEVSAVASELDSGLSMSAPRPGKRILATIWFDLKTKRYLPPRHMSLLLFRHLFSRKRSAHVWRRLGVLLRETIEGKGHKDTVSAVELDLPVTERSNQSVQAGALPSR